jgi:hypothetical protein
MTVFVITGLATVGCKVELVPPFRKYLKMSSNPARVRLPLFCSRLNFVEVMVVPPLVWVYQNGPVANIKIKNIIGLLFFISFKIKAV